VLLTEVLYLYVYLFPTDFLPTLIFEWLLPGIRFKSGNDFNSIVLLATKATLWRVLDALDFDN